MRFREIRLRGALVLACLAGCDCKPKDVQQVQPSLLVSPTGLSFGVVAVGGSRTLPVNLSARTNQEIEIKSVTLSGANPHLYTLSEWPETIEASGSGSFTVTFAPVEEGAFPAVLTISSNDPDTPEVKLAMVGLGGVGRVLVTVDCQTSRNCTDLVTENPWFIDYGQEPLSFAVQVNPATLPTLVVVNDGDAPIQVHSIEFGGEDLTAFRFTSAGLPDGGRLLEPNQGFSLPVRFTPSSDKPLNHQYEATLTVTSEDADAPVVSIGMTGTRLPNQGPTACANLVRVTPQLLTEDPRDYSSTAHWAEALTGGDGGVDLSAVRDVRPGDMIKISSWSSTDVTACSSDPEDGRNLTYEWTLIEDPTGPVDQPLGNVFEANFRPSLTGTYAVLLKVTDTAGAFAETTVRFTVAVKQDLVVQLEWPGFAGVDLDLHVVRPSAVDAGNAFTGAFSYFDVANTTSGDINGYAKYIASQHGAFRFDWGEIGSIDDPQLLLDNKGDVDPLIETVSLNFPQNDPLCENGCTYPVLVHFFKDDRQHTDPPDCTVTNAANCRDGEPCTCAAGQRCVADTPSDGGAPFGEGRCLVAPRPVVKVFLYGSPTPAFSVPVQDVRVGAPCHMWHVADINWPGRSAVGSLPDGGTPPPQLTVIGESGGVITPVIARFGRRPPGAALVCSTNISRTDHGFTDAWYAWE